MANLVARDIQTTTGANIAMIDRLSGQSVWLTSQEKLRDALVENEKVIVDNSEKWRIPLLNKFLSHMLELSYLGEDTQLISDQINSLCIN